MENIQLPSVSKTKRLPALGIVTALMVIAGSAFAEPFAAAPAKECWC